MVPPRQAGELPGAAPRQGRGRAGPDSDLARQRELVDAFFAAARDGGFDALVGVLDPGVVLRIDAGAARPAASMAIRGAQAVARQALAGLGGGLRVAQLRPALANGAAGVIITVRGRPLTVIGFAITDGKIVEIDAVADPGRVRQITTLGLNCRKDRG